MHLALILSQALAWLVAVAWTSRAIAAHRGLRTIPDLLLPAHDLSPAGMPTLNVIVPARNEQADVRACLESLLAQDYPNLQIIAIDDRSNDQTGVIMDELAAAYPKKLQVLHVTELPPDWLGKTHAMALAADHALATQHPDFLLFTDADVFFHPDAIRRALANAVATGADHFVLAPTTLIHRWDEAALLGFFQLLGLWAVQPWRVSNPRKLRDAIGIGAFNLVRSTAYQQIGGFGALRMEIVEDVGLGRRVKRAGLPQRLAFGRGLVSVHWAPGASGLIGVMTKNIFSAFNFHISLLLFTCAWLLVFCFAPFAMLFVRAYTYPASITIAAIAYLYFLMSSRSGLSAWNALLAPFAALLFIYTLLRSMFVTLRQGGVLWRGTFYPLAELRKHVTPLL